MKERPILFSGPMVRAILEGHKTQTRRLLTPQPEHLQLHSWRGKPVYEGEHRLWCWKEHTFDNIWDFGEHNEEREKLAALSPHGVIGDRLYVKETWQTGIGLDALSPSRISEQCTDAGYPKPWAPLRFAADGHSNENGTLRDFGGAWGKVRQSIFMPRWASRITLEVTDVRVQLLQEVSDSDSEAEGVRPIDAAIVFDDRGGHDRKLSGTARGAFACLWDSINGRDGRRWSDNPFVWALSFRRVETR